MFSKKFFVSVAEIFVIASAISISAFFSLSSPEPKTVSQVREPIFVGPIALPEQVKKVDTATPYLDYLEALEAEPNDKVFSTPSIEVGDKGAYLAYLTDLESESLGVSQVIPAVRAIDAGNNEAYLDFLQASETEPVTVTISKHTKQMGNTTAYLDYLMALEAEAN